MSSTRKTAVAGTFYPGRRDTLLSTLAELSPKGKEKRRAIAALSPHAGYMYSGEVAGELFSRIEVPDTVVVLAPNHTGMGAPFAVWSSGSWESPLGAVPIEESLAEQLISSLRIVEADETAHLREHSAEVQLPFLRYWNADLKLLPVVIGGGSLPMLRELGEAIAELREGCPELLVVASSDMTHYEHHDIATTKDRLAIDAILKLDPDALWQVVHENMISMCGCRSAVAMLYYAKKSGAQSAELIRYKTSGDTSGDYSNVVGYASVAVF